MHKILGLAMLAATVVAASGCGIIGGGNKSGNNAALCETFAAVQSADPLGKLDSGQSGAELHATFDSIQGDLTKMADRAPDKISAGVAKYTDGFDELTTDLETAGWDPTKLDADATLAKIEEGEQEIVTYAAESGHCPATGGTTTTS